MLIKIGTKIERHHGTVSTFLLTWVSLSCSENYISLTCLDDGDRWSYAKKTEINWLKDGYYVELAELAELIGDKFADWDEFYIDGRSINDLIASEKESKPFNLIYIS